MFISTKQSPSIEFNPEEGQREPTLVHFFSDRCDPFKTVLPQLIAVADGDEEHVFVVESPLSELLDYTIDLHRHQDFPDGVVVDERQRAFFAAVKLSLEQVIAKIDQIEFVTIDEDEDDNANVMA